MDKVDRRILSLLQSEAEISITELSERIGLSQTPCWRRVKKLESDGVISGRTVVLNPLALGLSVNVFASLKLRQHD